MQLKIVRPFIWTVQFRSEVYNIKIGIRLSRDACLDDCMFKAKLTDCGVAFVLLHPPHLLLDTTPQRPRSSHRQQQESCAMELKRSTAALSNLY